MKRQAMTVTIKELENLKQDLINQSNELANELKIKPDYDSSFLVGIINKSECSDTWEFEK